VFTASVAVSELEAWQITVEDLKKSPSFAVRTYESHRIFEFISGRKKMIDRFRIERRTVKIVDGRADRSRV
jgi:hypothetical protein